MPEYIDKNALLEKMKRTSRYFAVKYDIEEMPTVIVTPSAEIAREIFDEIEKLHLHITNDFDARRYEELKKKYTEGKK